MVRRYQKVRGVLPEIKLRPEGGMSQREVEECLGLKGDRPIHNLLKRERRKTQRIPKPCRRKPTKAMEGGRQENKRLRMENKLLRDFLQSTGRK